LVYLPVVIVSFIVINQFEERVVLQFKRNPYYQYFCGYSNYMPGMPCNATELVHFRRRIGVESCLSKSKPTISLMGFEGLPLS
jgi:IS5 family transposase